MKPETTFKDVTIKTYVKEYDKSNDKMMVEFVIEGTKYDNGTVVSKRATKDELARVHKKLITWSKTVITDNVKE